MTQDKEAEEAMKRIRSRLGGLRHGERMQRLRDERVHTDSRKMKREIDALIAAEHGAFMKKVYVRLAGWALVLAAIFFVLIKFGSPSSNTASSDKVKSTQVAKKKTPAKKSVLAQKQASAEKAKASQRAAKRAASVSAAKASRAAKVAASSKAAAASSQAAASQAAASSQAAAASSSAAAASAAAASREAASAASSAQQSEQSSAASSSTPAVQTPAPQPAPTYTVQAGDNLYRIAVNHGLTLEQIMQMNGLSEGYSLVPGQSIQLQ